MIQISELLQFTLRHESTRPIIDALANHIDIGKYYNIILNSEASKIQISTFEEYNQKFDQILNIIRPNLTNEECITFRNNKPYIDCIVSKIFKQLV